MLRFSIDVEQAQEALAYATDAYSKCPACSTAFLAARAAAIIGNIDLCAAWLRTAESSQLSSDEFHRLLRHSPEMQTMWNDLVDVTR